MAVVEPKTRGSNQHSPIVGMAPRRDRQRKACENEKDSADGGGKKAESTAGGNGPLGEPGEHDCELGPLFTFADENVFVCVVP